MLEQRLERILLLYSDPAEPVSSVILAHRAGFDCEVTAISMPQLLKEVAVGPRWNWNGITIDPATTAVVNRLTSVELRPADGPAQSPFERIQLSIWLYDELRRFKYASSLPSINAPIGGFGSLFDQWLDLPTLVPGLRVPPHESPWRRAPLEGDVYIVNPWQLYSLGRSAQAGPPAKKGELTYVRPSGLLFHVAQMGGLFLPVGAPPSVTAAQQDYITAFVRSMASTSHHRILEHAFFLTNDVPVFYAAFPVPVVTGQHPAYRDLILRGLNNDIDRYHRHPAP